MTGGNDRFWSYACPNGWVASPWTHRTNWSRSPRKPSVGSNASRTAIAISSPTAKTTICVLRRGGLVSPRPSPGVIPSGRPRRPVALRGAAAATEQCHLPTVGPDLAGHILRPAEQPVHLALVEGDAADLALELVADVGELGGDRDVGRDIVEDPGRQLVEPPEVAPPGVREVLVERDDAGVFGARHHPAATFGQQADTDLSTQLMVDV